MRLDSVVQNRGAVAVNEDIMFAGLDALLAALADQNLARWHEETPGFALVRREFFCPSVTAIGALVNTIQAEGAQSWYYTSVGHDVNTNLFRVRIGYFVPLISN